MDEDPDPVGSGDFLACRIRIQIRYFFHWIRILPVTTDLKNYFHLQQNINQNQQIQAYCDGL